MSFIDILKNVFSAFSECKKSSLNDKYSIIYNDSPYPDNLNFRRYECTGVFAETNRKRTRKIEAFTEDDALEEMKSTGFVEPITVKQIPFDPPSEAQIEACRKYHTIIPDKACKIDVTYIMDREIENDSIPNPDLLRYATEMKITTSYYAGKRNLYCNIFRSLDLRDKIAFFAFCIYRFLSKDRYGNLNHSPHKDLFYSFADTKLSDKSFITSMNRYSGDQLRYFGEYRVGNTVYDNGGSKNTTAYKAVLKFLEEQHLLLVK